MDTSDSDNMSEESDGDLGDESDADFVMPTRKVREHRKTVSRHTNLSLGCQSTQENAEPEKKPKDVTSDGCSCSKASSCKTKLCECRGSGAHCGPGCGCKDSKCSNRDSSDNTETLNQGIVIIKNIFSEKDAEDAKTRKPLADIGNNEEVRNVTHTFF